MDISQQILGDKHIITGKAYNEFGLILSQSGKFDVGISYFTKALDIHEQLIGKDYPEIAKSALEEMVRQCGEPEFDDQA
mgnify:CR=1 FL=1